MEFIQITEELEILYDPVSDAAKRKSVTHFDTAIC